MFKNCLIATFLESVYRVFFLLHNVKVD